ncbi:allantoinase [Tanacetum coccineum]
MVEESYLWLKKRIDRKQSRITQHAYLDDPGRTEWEGFPSGTKAAAAGGITTLIDMPLNSYPSTVSKETLQLKEGLSLPAKYKRPLLVHAEKQKETQLDDGVDDPRSYSTYLKTRPASILFAEGDFLRAWRGISSLQFVLPVTWSYGLKYGVTLEKLVSWWSEKPAKLAGQDFNGVTAIGKHADIAFWEPEEEFDLDGNHPVHLKHPGISAYMGSRLSGRVLATFVNRNLVFEDGKHAPAACGTTILA